MLSSEPSLREQKELCFLSFMWKRLSWLLSFCRGSQELWRTSFKHQTQPNQTCQLSFLGPHTLRAEERCKLLRFFCRENPSRGSSSRLPRWCYPMYVSNPVSEEEPGAKHDSSEVKPKCGSGAGLVQGLMD